MAPRPNSDGPPPLPRDRKKRGCLFWGLVLGGGFMVLVVGGLLTLGVLVETGYLPPTKVVEMEDLREKHQDFLRQEVLEEGERGQWFYTAGIFSIKEDGNLLTDRRVVTYFEDEGEVSLDSVRLEDVVAVRAVYGEFFEDGELHVWSSPWIDEETELVYAGDTESLLLFLSEEESLDHRFVEELVMAAKDAGADLVSIELGGSATKKELRSIEGAVRYEGDDSFEPPAAVSALMPE